MDFNSDWRFVMIVIGLIDDNTRELDDIKASIARGWEKEKPMSDDVDFKQYQLAHTEEFKETLEKELIDDIAHNRIQGLIIDYKLDSMHKVIEGKDIAEYLHSKVPAFPVVVLTNVPERGKEEDLIDPDKVYDKKTFLDLDNSPSAEMVFNIRRNIERYMRKRKNLEDSLSLLLNQFDRESDSDEKIKLLVEISNTEDMLADYTQTGKSTAEKSFDLSGLKGLVSDLIELEKNL